MMNERKIEFLYNILHRWEAGMVLKSADVVAIRDNKFNIQNAFVIIDKNREVWLKNVKSNGNLHEVKLLLNKSEISKLYGYYSVRSVIIMAFGISRVKKYLKVKIGVGTVKNKIDKRESIKEKDLKRRSNDNE